MQGTIAAVPELCFEEKQLIPALRQLLASYSKPALNLILHRIFH